MRLFLGCFITGFTLLLCFGADAQTKLSVIQGHILLPAGASADSVSIVLLNLPDSARIKSTALKKSGNFTFTNIKAGKYLVRITCSGLKPYISAPLSVSGSLISIGDIDLKPVITGLREIDITSQKNFVEHKADRTVLNVNKAVLADGVSVLDILNSAPGLRVRSSGDIAFSGGQKAAIAINGKVINLSSQDVAQQFQNMPSGSIERVEIIPNPSSKYDAGGSGGMINIVLRKGINSGFNGSITEGFGYGNFGKSTSIVNLNYRKKSFNFFGTYSLVDNNTDHTIITDRYIGTATNFNVNYYNKQHTFANNYTVGADYNIDENHTIGVLVTGYFYNAYLKKNTVSAISNHSVLDSTLTTLSGLNRRFGNTDYNINYSGKLGKTRQTISADADYSRYSRTNDENLSSNLLNTHTGVITPAQYTNYAPTHFNNISGRVDYTDPLRDGSRIEAGLKSIGATSDNAQYFDQIVNKVSVSNTVLSSQFKYTENITSAYINYLSNTGGKVNYQLGLRAEHTESTANTLSEMYKAKRSYTDYFPTAMLSFKADTNHLLALTYTKRIDRPTYQDLNPIIAYQDKYNFTVGNAYLRPAYTDKIELKEVYKEKFTAAIYAQFVRDAFNYTFFTQNDATGLYTSGKSNLKSTRTFGISLVAQVDFASWWHMDIAPEGCYQRFEDYAGLLNKGAIDAMLKLNQQIKLPADMILNVFAQYEVPNFYTIYNYRSVYYANAGLRKQLFNKNASVTFSVDDVFDTNRDRYSSTYANLNLTGYDKKETRIFRLTFLYRFGQTTAPRNHVNGNSDDLKRLAAGS